MPPTDMLNVGFLTNSQFVKKKKKKMQYLGNTIKQGMSIFLKQAIKIRLPQKLKF